MRLLRDGPVMPPRAARLPSVGPHRPVLMLRWWWNSVFGDDDKVLPLRLSGNFGLGTAYGWVDWCLAIRMKVMHVQTTCVGDDGDGAFGCRLPPWRRRCEALAPFPIFVVLSPSEKLIWRAELAMAASSMSLLC
jgi:hypothetical protein